jgi:hypothetical protein
VNTVEWGSEAQVMQVHESLLNLGLDEQHGAIACPLGTDPTHFPPPFPIVVTAAPIRTGYISEGQVCDLYYWVSKEAWVEAGF